MRERGERESERKQIRVGKLEREGRGNERGSKKMRVRKLERGRGEEFYRESEEDIMSESM